MKKAIIYLAFLIIVACSDTIEPIGEPVIPKATTLIFPENNTECNTGIEVDGEKSRVNFQWNASENTDVYEVIIKELDTDIEIRSEADTNDMEITIKKATAYQWHVVSKSNTHEETSDSEVWRFYNSGDGIVNYAPFPADIIEPILGDNLDANTTNVSLKWSGSDVDNDIISYEIYFGTVNPPSSTLGQTTASNIEVTVETGNTYYWTVKTIDNANNISISETFWFRVD